MNYETTALNYETAALIAYGYVAQIKPTPRQMAVEAAAKEALARFRRDWRITPAPKR